MLELYMVTQQVGSTECKNYILAGSHRQTGCSSTNYLSEHSCQIYTCGDSLISLFPFVGLHSTPRGDDVAEWLEYSCIVFLVLLVVCFLP